MSHETGAEGSDSAVYPELARANLLRMRGDYKAAESQCLAILRRYPNNATANILLGDICAEKGDLDQSMQWYEMALDLTPESQAAQHKLEQVKLRFKEKETAQTVEQLGLPTTKSRAGIYALALIAAVFIFAVAMYFAGQRVGEKRADPNRQAPVKPSEDPTIDPGFVPTSGNERPNARTDADLVKSIQATGTEGGRVLAAMQDPRSHALVVSFSVLEGEDARSLGAFVAQQAFQQVTDAPVVTLRGLKQGQVVYIADAMRSLYEETLTQNWTAEHQSNTNAWIDHILTHEWPLQNATTTPPPNVSTNPTTIDEGAPPGDSTVTPPTDATTGGTTAGDTVNKDDTTKKDDGPATTDDTGGTGGGENSQNTDTPPGGDESAPPGSTTGE